MGTTSDHLFDLVADLSAQIGNNPPVRFGALSMFESRATLAKAARISSGEAGMPSLTWARAQVIFSLARTSSRRGFRRFRTPADLQVCARR